MPCKKQWRNIIKGEFDMANVFIFRIANNIDFVKNEIKQGRLRQGWGNSCSELRGVSEEKWIELQCAKYPETEKDSNQEYYKKRYKLLIKMLEIKEGDILIIPKTPEYNKFTICRASGEYTFCKPDSFDIDDFYHVIPIDINSIREFSYHADEDCEIIHAKLRGYQSPVNNVWNKAVINAAETLVFTCSNIEDQSVEELVKGIKEDILKKTALERFRNLGNRGAENIVRLIFENMGYEYIRRNSYDKKGGDADLIFADNSFGELADISLNGSEISGEIFVQVKNKVGTDSNDVEGVKQLIKRAEDENAAIKILISSANNFTQECKEMANKNNVLLIDGNGFLNLIFRYIV